MFYYYFAYTQIWQSGKNTGASNALKKVIAFLCLKRKNKMKNQKKKKRERRKRMYAMDNITQIITNN